MPFAHSTLIRRLHRIALVALAFAALAGAGVAWAAVTSVVAQRPNFSPNGDGVRDTVTVTWILNAPAESLFIEVRASGVADSLRLIRLGPRPAGVDSAGWDGRDDAGVVQSDRLYTVRVVERDSLRVPLSEGSVTVVIDTQPPGLPRFEPDFNGLDTTDSLLEVTGIAPGAVEHVIVFSNGAPLDTIPIAAGDSAFAQSILLAPGTSALALQSEDRAGNRSPLSLASSVTYRNTADVLDYRVAPTRFSPNADGVLDSTRITFSLDAPTTQLAVEIRQAAAGSTTLADSVAYVRLHDGPASPGSFAFSWAGLDSTGAPAPQGNYFAFVQAESSAVDGSPAPGRPRTTRVELDLTPPPPPTLTEPIPDRTTHASLHVVGTVSGGDSVRVYRNGTRVAQSGSSFDVTVTLLRGANTIVLEGVDGAGNVSAPGGPYVVVYDELVGFHAPERFRRGDLFEVNLSRSPSALRIDLYALDGRHLRVLESTSSNPNQELGWDLLDFQGREVGDGPIVAKLTVAYPDGDRESTKAAVVVTK